MMRAGASWALLMSCPVVAPVMATDLISPVGQQRSVVVTATVVDNAVPESDSDADSLHAPDYGLFEFNTTAQATVTNATASSSGSQTSEILGGSIQATGGTSAVAESFDYDASGLSNGDSHCEVTFDVTAGALFALTGEIVAAGTGVASVSLDGPMGTIFSITEDGNQTTSISENGSLEAATHTLVISATGSAFANFFFSNSGSSSYDLVLRLEPVTGVSTSAGGRALLVAAPNPFRESTTITHAAPYGTAVELFIFDVGGRRIRTLSDRGSTLSWDGRDGTGGTVRPGVYFVRLEKGGELHRLKITRIR